MNTPMNLKQLERKAFRSTYQDGLHDVLWGLIIICMAFFIYRPESGYSPMNIFLLLVAFALSNLLFWLGKKYITVPRMGQVTFGPMRAKRKKTLAIIMVVVIVIQAGFVALTAAGWLNAEFGEKISSLLGGESMEHMLVAAIGALFVGPSMMLMAWFSDFMRGYYIAVLMALAVFLMILLNKPIYPALLGVLVLVPGVVLFIRFLRKYPLPEENVDHE